MNLTQTDGQIIESHLRTFDSDQRTTEFDQRMIQIDERMTMLVTTERGTTREILELIRMAEAARLPQHLGYRNTYQWLIQRHKYSGGAANRRIQAARLLKDLPEIAEKVETGAVNLSTLCKMQTVIRAQHKSTGNRPTVETKREAMSRIENKTCNEAEQALHTLFPDAEVGIEKVVQKGDGGQRCTTELSPEAVKLLERVREILSHTLPGASTGELIERLAKEFVERHDPISKAERKNRDRDRDRDRENRKQITQRCRTEMIPQRKNDAITSAQPEKTASRKRTLPPSVRREVIRRAGGQCEYAHENRRCTSRYQLEADHIVPKAKGGSDALENLRCLCRNHNQLMADREFGQSFMAAKRSGI